MPSIDSTVGGASSNSYATVSDADTYFNDGTEYAENAIPTIVKYACYELALQYEIDRGDSKTPLLDTGLEEYTEAEVGSLKMTRNRSFSAGQLPATVQRLLRPVITTAGNSRRVGAAY